MKLLIDIGNSRLKWALHDGDALTPSSAVEHGGDAAQALAAIPARAVDTLRIAHVMGTAHEAALATAAQQRFGVAPQFARVRDGLAGLQLAYADMSRLGVDRWLMMLAAWRETRDACCVVSAGTALTFDAIGAGGHHLGGFIAPGLAAMLKATLGNTRFPTAALDARYDANLGTDTESCVRQGAYLACVGAIERGIAAANTSGAHYLCGGDAALLLPALGNGWRHRPDLVLEGLLVLDRLPG